MNNSFQFHRLYHLLRHSSLLLACALAIWSGPANCQDFPEPLRGYSKFEDIEARLKRLESPQTKLTSLGKTLGGRDVWVLTVAKDLQQTKPAILIVGNVVAPHVIGRELATRMAEQVLQKAGTDDALTDLLDKHTLYFIPSPTPDATEKNFRFPVRSASGNNSKTDDDRDFEVGEDAPVDLNQDGWITMMRVQDDFGTHRTHPKDPRVLIPIDANKREVGQFKLLTESKDVDQDEQFGEDAADGVDFNRNFTFEYKVFSQGAGPHQVSEIETRALADFMFDHPNIAFVICFSPEDNLFHTWKGSAQTDSARIKTKVLSADQEHLNSLAESFRKLHGGKDAPASPAGEGSFSEFSYFHFGRWTLSSRGWWIPKIDRAKNQEKAKAQEKPADSSTNSEPANNAEPKQEAVESTSEKKAPEPEAASTASADKAKEQPATKAVDGLVELDKDDKRGAEDLAALSWFESQGISGFVDWQKIDHPDFPGKLVEVGGIKPLFALNPPVAQIDSLVSPHVSLLSLLARNWPKVEVREIKANDLGSGLFDIRCKIVNTGALPTMPEMGSVNRQWYPLQVKLLGADTAKMIEGSLRISVGKLSENGGEKELRWVFLQPSDKPADFRIEATAPTLSPVSVPITVVKASEAKP